MRKTTGQQQPQPSPVQPFPELLTDLIIRSEHPNAAAVARAAGLTPSTLSRWLRGRARPEMAALEALSRVLKVSTAQLAASAYPDHYNAVLLPSGQSSTLHPLARELDELLQPEAGVPEPERRTLATLIEHIIAPYRGRRNKS